MSYLLTFLDSTEPSCYDSFMEQKNISNKLSKNQIEDLVAALKSRFDGHKNRHEGLNWVKIQEKLEANPEKLWSLNEMELTGGEPDVVGYDKSTDEYVFVDCSAEIPEGRRSLCYGQDALEARRANKPKDSAMNMAASMGIELLTEDQYHALQALGDFDTKTSSWVRTPANIRKLGGALFGDRRFGRVFIYHNGADSYYAARGFRGTLRV